MTAAKGATSTQKTGKSPKKPKRTKAENRAIHMRQQASERKRIAEATASDVAKINSPGRPTKYSQKIVTTICEGIAAGYSMRTVLRDNPDLPTMKTIFNWFGAMDKEGAPLHPEFLQQYERAQAMRTEAMAEDVLDIADNSTNDYMEHEDENGRTYETYNPENVARAKLRIDVRLHLMAKHKPKKYGTQQDPGNGLPPQVALIYLPREMPYNATKVNNQDPIDGEIVEPAQSRQNSQQA